MPKTFLQPVEVISEVLHAENQASIRAEPQRVVLHHVVHLDQLSDICYCKENKMDFIIIIFYSDLGIKSDMALDLRFFYITQVKVQKMIFGRSGNAGQGLTKHLTDILNV